MENNNTPKQLLRSNTDRKIAGVCGGLAKYFNVDSNVVRIGFVIATFAGTLGIWAYLVIWLMAPEE